MKQRISEETIGRVALIGLALLLLFLRFPDFFQSPNSKVIEAYADGIKAYTVIEYHARYDSTYSWFEGMNYPYKEHVVPAATQPLLSTVIKLVSDYVVDISPYTRAIVHASLLLGLILCAWFLYLLFRKLKVPVWVSVGFALGISFLAPQFQRMISHYGLAHPEVLPIILYLLLRLEETKSWKTSVWIAIATTAYSLIHFYYFAIITFVISFYFLFGFLRKPGWHRLLRYGLHYSIQLILPLVFFYFWMYHNDPVTDRTSQPWGFFYFKAIWEGIYTSMAQPHFQWVDQQLIKIEESTFEGQAYIGLIAVLGSAVLLIRWIIGMFRKEGFAIVRAGGMYNAYLNKIFWTGLLLLFFSFCWPFIWTGFEWLADYAGPIRQFRSVGRFSWAFYYIINIIVIVELWAWLKEKDWKLAVIIPALLLLCYEAYNYSYFRNLDLDDIKELHPGNQYTDIPGIDYDEFQAIITVPHYNVGSDNFWREGAGDIVPRSLILSLQTGLPTTSAMLTRTSLSQTIKQIELISEPYREPAILKEYPNDKPLLLILSKYLYSQHEARYKHLLEEAQLLYDHESYQLYRLSLDTFRKRIDSRKRDIQYTIENDTLELRPHGDFMSRDTHQTFQYLSYDSLSADVVYRGSGALQGPAIPGVTLFEDNIPQQQAGGYYTFSFWIYVAKDLSARSWAHIIETDATTGNEINRKSFQPQTEIRAIDNGWGLAEVVFVTAKSDSKVRLVVENTDLKDELLHFDEFLLRPEVSDIYREENAYWFKNNRWFSREEE